jgi:hypothetical protein
VVTDGRGEWVGLLVFNGAAKHLKLREKWIGWTGEQARRRLSLVVNNSRFLLLPHQNVPNLGSKAFSPTVIVYADEIISQARLLAQGFVLDDDTVALHEIAQVGPGGSFLTSGLTLKLFRRAYYRSRILPMLTLEEWQARGCPRADHVLRRYTRQLIDELKPPPDHADLIARGEAFIRSVEARNR